MGDALVLTCLSVAVRGTRLIDDISAEIAPGRITVILGPNGAGKSTLLAALAGILPCEGDIRHGAVDITALRPLERARRIAYLPQAHELAWDISVADMVALGRFAYGAVPGRLAPTDRDAVEQAMTATGCTGLGARGVTSLSGGEQALACLSRVLAADTPILFADEPVAALDPANQYRVMECLAARAAKGQMIVAVLHDLSLAAQFADDIIWLDGGRLAAHGPASREAFEEHVPLVFKRQPFFGPAGLHQIHFRRGEPPRD